MKILVDTNVLMDVLIGREPFCNQANEVIRLCLGDRMQGYLAAHSISNLFYLLRKHYTVEERRNILYQLCSILEIAGVDKENVLKSLRNNKFTDFEDCLQMGCALDVNADYIVTRNVKDFVNSEIKAIEPDAFLQIIG